MENAQNPSLLPAPVATVEKRERATWLVAAGVLFLKLVKSAKFVKFALFLASLGALALNRPFESACVILYAIFIHESGHVLAMRASGLKTSGMYFLPFLGAVAVAKEPARTRGQEWFIAIARPGLRPALAPAAHGDCRGDGRPAMARLCRNRGRYQSLQPAADRHPRWRADRAGDRLSIAGWAGIGAFALGLGLGAYFLMHRAGGLVSLILVLSILEFAAAWRRNRGNPIPPMRWPSLLGAGGAYLGLLAFFAIAQEDFFAAAQVAGL
jgi:hypothetical protein